MITADMAEAGSSGSSGASGASRTLAVDRSLLKTLLSGERFWPAEPATLAESGLGEPFVEALICKSLLVTGSASGRSIADCLGLPYTLVEPELARLRARQLLVHKGSGPLNDYRYALTEEGRRHAQGLHRECAYVGTAPVPLADYVLSVEAQAIADETIRRSDLHDAFYDISVDPRLLDLLGPAVNSGAGLFLYGAPGNGKSTLAMRLTACFGQSMWVPYAVAEGNEIIKVFDPAYHRVAQGTAHGGTADEKNFANFDRRWVRIRRPTVIVGGELTMDNLEIRHDRVANVSEAPLQVKSNGGCLLIDDFGRQRIAPADLLNRWIVPLESRHDFLTLPSGRKIQVPFQQLIIFSTNVAPEHLVDEAFLRRIPYKIEITDPPESEFHELFRLTAERFGCDYDAAAVEYLLENHYRPHRRPLRRCHARDLMLQIRNYCAYHEMPFEMLPEYFDRVADGFFTTVATRQSGPVRD
jgi:predicted ATPase with chaperone activity